MLKTELIASWKLVNNGIRDMYIVTTVTGQSVWINKSQFDTNAEQVTYTVKKAGEEYVKSDGTKGNLKIDRNEFNGCGRQIVKKFSSIEILDHLANKGITPQFSLQ